jgi:uncharacterized protein (DUF697 family)
MSFGMVMEVQQFAREEIKSPKNMAGAITHVTWVGGIGKAYGIEACFVVTFFRDFKIGRFALIDSFTFLAYHPYGTKPNVQQIVHYFNLFYSPKT